MSTKLNDNYDGNINEEDDFLDSLMDDLMEDRSDKAPSDISTIKAIESEASYEDTSIKLEEKAPVINEEERPRQNKRSGLLNRIGSFAEKEDIDNNSEIESQTHVNEKEVPNEEVINEYKKTESNEKGSSPEKKSSLLDRMRERRQEKESEVNQENEVMEDEDVLENIIEEEEYEKQEELNRIESQEKDNFDDMLDVFSKEDLHIDNVNFRTQLDESVEIPLETPEMNEIKVTADGKTLADMLIGMRSGNQSMVNKVAKVRNQEEIIEIGKKKFSDDRYTKHVKVIDEETKKNEEKVALSMKFLQRNASFTEQEKIIMKNLGLNSNQLSNIMGSKKLSKKEKEKILSLGRYGAEKHFKGRRYRTTVGDTAVLEFLVKFKFANTRILRWLSNEPQGRTWRKLNRLRNSGLVESKSIIGIPDLWGATQSGVAIAGYALNPGLRPMPKIPTIASDMGVNYIAACLWFNSVNVLNLDDFPAHNRIIALQDDGRDRVQGEMLVSELEIRSSLGKEINPSSTTMSTLGDERLYDVIASNVRQAFEEWEYGGKVGDSPEFLLGNEYMWVLYPTSQLTLSYHVPDLIVKRDRGPNGEPKSIAIEIERYKKSNNRYDKIMLAYKLDEHLYEKVIWLTPNASVARALEKAAKSVGFERYAILPIITESGIYDKQDIWMI